MARSKSHKRRRRTPTLDARTARKRIQEAMQAGAFQTARTLAKELFKRDRTAEHQRLFVAATVGRAVQLRRGGQLEASADMLRSLQECRIEEPELVIEASREALLAGDWRVAEQIAAQSSDPAIQRRLQGLRADAAVLSAAVAAESVARQWRQPATAVMAALSHLADGQDQAAMDAVAHIADGSPMHDWRLLVEGLVQHYAGGQPAGWRRLTPGRLPAAIASLFQGDGYGEEPADGRPSRPLHQCRSPLHHDWCRLLEAAAECLDRGQTWLAFEKAAAALRGIGPEHEPFRQRVVQVMYWQAVQSEGRRGPDLFRRLFPAPALDRRLERLRALHSAAAGDLIQAQRFWHDYELRVSRGGVLPPQDTPLARSLIWLRMGRLAERAEAADEWLQAGPLSDEAGAARTPYSAENCFRRSVELAPEHLAAHEALLELLQSKGRLADAAEHAAQLLERCPEHHRSLTVVAEHAYRCRQFERAVQFQQRAVRLRPHDQAGRDRLGQFRIGWARQQAQSGRFDSARDLLAHELARLTDDVDGAAEPVRCLLAAVEYKAGRPAEAQAALQLACNNSQAPPAVRLYMLIEAVRMPLERPLRERCLRDWQRELKAKANGLAALRMLLALKHLKDDQADYPGRQEHQKLVLDYVAKCSRVRLGSAHMLRLCRLLMDDFERHDLAGRLAKRGHRLHPLHPAFALLVAEAEVARGPQGCRFRVARRWAKLAYRLAQRSAEYAEVEAAAVSLLQALDFLQFISSLARFAHQPTPRLGSGRNGFPARALNCPPELFELLEALQQDDDEEADLEDEDDVDDEQGWLPPLSLWGGRNKRRKAKRRR